MNLSILSIPNSSRNCSQDTMTPIEQISKLLRVIASKYRLRCLYTIIIMKHKQLVNNLTKKLGFNGVANQVATYLRDSKHQQDYLRQIEKIENRILEAVNRIEKYYQQLQSILHRVCQSQSQPNMMMEQDLLSSSSLKSHEVSGISDNILNSNYCSKNSFFELSSDHSRHDVGRQVGELTTIIESLHKKTGLIDGLQINSALQAKLTKSLSDRELQLEDTVQALAIQLKQMRHQLGVLFKSDLKCKAQVSKKLSIKSK